MELKLEGDYLKVVIDAHEETVEIITTEPPYEPGRIKLPLETMKVVFRFLDSNIRGLRVDE